MNLDREVLLEMTDEQFNQYSRNALINASIEMSVMAANDSKFSFDACMEKVLKVQTMNEEFMAIIEERKARK